MSNENIKKTVRTISIDELIEQEGSNELMVESNSNKNLSKEELRELKKENRYYLPVLYLNHMDMYPSKPNSERQHWTDKKAMETCLGNCCGIPGTKAMCCKLNPDHLEHVIGPVDEKWIKKTIEYFRKKGITMTRQDLVIEYEEGVLIGQNFFKGHAIFERKDAYPIMRMKLEGPHFSCIFLNSKNNMCNIYEVRPELCRVYLCGYVKSNFFVKGKRKQNVWEKLDIRPKDEEEK
jgi:Fe-S-cluster containining protein